MTSLKPSEVLEKAAALIEPEGAWTREHYARDADAEPTFWDGPQAACWCAVGAIARAAHVSPVRHDLGPYGLAYLARALGSAKFAVPQWNDAPDRTQAEVVAALRKAAELARSEGQ